MAVLADELEAAAGDLRSPGQPVGAELLRKQEQVTADLAALGTEIASAAASNGIAVAQGEASHLEGLDRLLDAIETNRQQNEHREALAREVDAQLEVLLSIESTHASAQEGLARLRTMVSDARSLRDRLAELDETELATLASFVEAQHPARALVRYLTDDSGLDDAAWRADRDRVAEAFGGSFETAVSRNRITLAKPWPAVGSAPEPADEAPTEVTPKRAEPGSADAAESRTVVPEVAATGEAVSAEHAAEPIATPPITGPDEPSAILDEGAPTEEVSAEEPSAEEPSAEEPSAEEPSAEEALAFIPEPTVTEPQVAEEAAALLRDRELAHLARTGLEAPDERTRRLATDMVAWELCATGRPGLAWHLARALEQSGHRDVSLPASLARALALAPAVTLAGGEIVTAVQEAMHELHEVANELDEREPSEREAVEATIVSACLRPALLLPATGAESVLGSLRLEHGLGPLRDLRTAILEYTKVGLTLDPTLLAGLNRRLDWEAEIDRLRDECRQWLEDSRRGKIKFAAATDVWRRWLDDEGVLGALLNVVVRDDRALESRTRQRVDELSDPQRLRRIIPSGIEGGARRKLQANLVEAIEWPRRWLELLRQKSWNPDDFQFQAAQQCRDEILRVIEGLGSSDQPILDTAGTWQASPATRIVSAALEDLGRLFAADGDEVAGSVPYAMLANGELLRVDGVTLDDAWQPLSTAPMGMVAGVLDALIRDEPWDAVFGRRCEEGDQFASRQILRLIEALKQTGQEELERLARRREEALAAGRVALGEELERVRHLVEEAVADDLLTESELHDLDSRLESIEIARAERLGALRRALQRIGEEIAGRREARLEEVRSRLDDVENLDAADRQRIEAALSEGDAITANELLDALRTEGRLPTLPETDDEFEVFFPTFGKRLAKFMGSAAAAAMPGAAIAREISAGRSYGPVKMGGVPGSQAERAGRMVSAWFQLKRRLKLTEDPLRDLLTAMGLEVLKLSRSRDQTGLRHGAWDVQTTPLVERRTCPVPRYGSIAGGGYRVVGLWERGSEDETLDFAAQHAHARPLLLLYFGRLTEQRRRDLARLCRERGRDFLVVDEVLVMYLCGTRESPLQRLFRCALPFTVGEPYTTVAGLVPVEMFFGRTRERASVFDLFGTNLVYGGRQLGKTALLRDVVRRYHRPDAGVLVCFVDLKAEGIGLNRPIGDIWEVLVVTLGRAGVPIRAGSGKEALQARVQEWLDETVERRIVLLLDEADGFLENDAADAYRNVEVLKGLMDVTERRFKVVFAGLHNVQRTSRDANTPLAHLGAPVCIGPLLAGGESREAIDLVRVPMEALGYRFESPRLPLRIASHANFYPSLIQLFCRELLSDLNNPNRVHFDPRQTPPYEITANHIDEAYQRRELRKAILDRFRWTLDLDQRYRLIALLIALESTERRSEGALFEGFSLDWIRGNALRWWAAGFREDDSREAFATMLEEMIGLGLLTRTPRGRYALRSPNVLSLLGTQREIENEILDTVAKEPRLEYEASSFRRALEPEHWLRSPLSAAQESEILAKQHGVAVVFGSRLAGLELLHEALELACRAGLLFRLEETIELPRFRSALEDRVQRARRSEAGLEGEVLAIVVPAGLGWNKEWVAEALDYVEALRTRKHSIRVVFVGDTSAAWHWIQAGSSARFEARPLTTHVLRPWSDAALRRWMQDTSVGPGDTPDARREIFEVTGGWPLLVHELGRRCEGRASAWREQLDAIEERVSELTGGPAGLGLSDHVRSVLSFAAEFEEGVSASEVKELEEFPPDTVQSVFEWSDFVRFMLPSARGKWRVDPIVTRILTEAGEG